MHNLKKLWLRRMCLLTFLAVSQASDEALASEMGILRKGFTVEFSMGVSGNYVNSRGEGSSRNYWGLGGLNLMIGGFVDPQWAVLFKFSGTNFGAFTNALKDGVTGVGGPAFEYWVSDHFNISAGIGLGVVTISPLGVPDYSEGGFGLMAGIRYYPLALVHHGLGFYFETAPVVTRSFISLSYQAGISWQYY